MFIENIDVSVGELYMGNQNLGRGVYVFGRRTKEYGNSIALRIWGKEKRGWGWRRELRHQLNQSQWKKQYIIVKA